MDNSSETNKMLTGFASGLRKIRSIVDKLGDLGQTTIQVLRNIGRINNAIEKTATDLSFVSTAAELARFTELSTKVKTDIEEALKKRMAFMSELKPKSDKDTTAFIAGMNEYKPNGLTEEEARHAESPAATAYALYFLSLMELQSDGERLAEWLEGKAVKHAADNSQAAVDEIRNHGQPKNKQAKKHGRTLTQKELDENIRKNELITEIRRRAKSKYTLGADGITAAYDEIDKESKQAGSKWLSIMSLAPRKAIIDKAQHDKRYVTAQ